MNLSLYRFHLEDKVSDYFYRIDNESNLPGKDKYLVQTRSQVRSSGIRLPEIHGCKQRDKPTPQAQKDKDHYQPYLHKTYHPLVQHNLSTKDPPTHPIPKPRIGQGRAGLRRKAKAPLPIASPIRCLFSQ